jgi:hypothetical protein
MPDSRYKRLTWRSRRPTKIALTAPRATLLLGEDHILKVDATPFSESYRRFFFRDIQSITIKTNRRRLVWNIVLGTLLLIFLLEGLVDTVDWGAWAITMMILSAITGAFLVINNLFGTACDVRIETAVQSDNLPPLSRVRRANDVLDRLRPLIVQAQGQFTPEETVARLREAAGLTTKAGTITPPRPLNL